MVSQALREILIKTNTKSVHVRYLFYVEKILDQNGKIVETITSKLFNFPGTYFYNQQKLLDFVIVKFYNLDPNYVSVGIKLCQEKKKNSSKVFNYELFQLSSSKYLQACKMSVRIYTQIYILVTLLKGNSNQSEKIRIFNFAKKNYNTLS